MANEIWSYLLGFQDLRLNERNHSVEWQQFIEVNSGANWETDQMGHSAYFPVSDKQEKHPV